MEPIFVCEIAGRCFVKKNSKRVFGSGKRKRFIYTPEFQRWEAVAMQAVQIKQRELKILHAFNFDIHAKYTFYFENHSGEADLSNLLEGPSDLLQDAGVIKNDRLIQSYDGSRKLFGHKPGLKIELFKFLE